VGWRVFIERGLLDIDPQNRGVTPSAGAPQALSETRYRRWRSDLRHALDGADVDAELEGRGTNDTCRAAAVLDGGLGVLAKLLREVAVVGPEFVRHLVQLAEAAEQVGQLLDAGSGVGEDQVVVTPQVLEDVPSDREGVAIRHVLWLDPLAGRFPCLRFRR
jgi:hypothetical protein